MLFVTGMLRCGTTLLEKLLASHPEISLLSQPFPFLFFDAKRRFLQTFGATDAYPLGDLFLEERYSPEDFAAFLRNFQMTRDELLAIFAQMTGYSGQCTRFSDAEVQRAVASAAPGDFAATLVDLYRQLARRPDARWFGAKETLCEEYVPYLLERGAACAIILRDPRDMLASLNHGRGQAFGGTVRPTLFNLRQWRKSVAFALHLRDRPLFSWMRYEDLVTGAIERLNIMARALGIAPFAEGLFDAGIPDQDGGRWQGNSSHFADRGLDASSVGTYRDVLPPSVTTYAEAVCYPELTALGYETSVSFSDAADIIREYQDPYPNVREHLRDIFAGPARTTEELARLSEIATPGSRYYVFNDVRERLRKAVER